IMRPNLDITGQRFGRLVARTYVKRPSSAFGGARWLCDCDCGKQRLVSKGNLASGSTISCGCIGKGRRLKPSGPSDRPNRETRNAYMRGWMFRHRERINAERRQQKIERPLRFLLKKAKARARELNMPFDLTEADFPGELPCKCPVLGIEILY